MIEAWCWDVSCCVSNKKYGCFDELFTSLITMLLLGKLDMKMKFKFGIVLCMITSCHSNMRENVHADKVITFKEEGIASISQDIDSVSYLPLESDSLAYFSNGTKVVFREGKIFVGDLFQHKIVVYSDAGKFLFTLNSRGRAANEYLEIKSFCVTDHEIAIIDNYNHFFKIYDVETGRFLMNKKMPFVAWDVEGLDRGGYVFAFSPANKEYHLNKARYRLFFTDNDLNITKKLFPYEENEFAPIGKMTYFSSSREKILFHWCGASYFSVIDRVEGDSIKIVAVDFGDKEITDKYRDDMEKINQSGSYYIGETPVTNGNYIALEILSRDTYGCYLYSMKDNVMTQNYDGESMVMPYPLGVDEQGRFICLLNSFGEYEMLVNDGFPRASKEVEDHMENGGVTILKYVTK